MGSVANNKGEFSLGSLNDSTEWIGLDTIASGPVHRADQERTRRSGRQQAQQQRTQQSEHPPVGGRRVDREMARAE